MPGETVPCSPLSHPMRARQAAQTPDQPGQHMTEVFSSFGGGGHDGRAGGARRGGGMGGPRAEAKYSICSHVYRMSYYVVHGREDQSRRADRGRRVKRARR